MQGRHSAQEVGFRHFLTDTGDFAASGFRNRPGLEDPTADEEALELFAKVDELNRVDGRQVFA